MSHIKRYYPYAIGDIYMIKKAIKELVCRLAPKNIYLPILTGAAKVKCFKLVEPYIWWYIKGSEYHREYESAMSRHARIYIAYDGCFDLGTNFERTIARGWFFTALYCKGIVHPAIKAEIVSDHKEEFPLDYCLMQLNKLVNSIKVNTINYWQLCTIYVLSLVIANLY